MKKKTNGVLLSADGVKAAKRQLKSVSDTDLQQEINEEHHLARSCAERAVDHVMRCGELLCEQKRRLPHGQFSAWIKEHCDFSHDTANLYMRACRRNTKGLVFSSISQMLSDDRAAKASTRGPDWRFTPQYMFDTVPNFDLPPGVDAKQWSYAHQTAKRIAWFAKFVGCINPLEVVRGTLPDELKKLKADVWAVSRFTDELIEWIVTMENGGVDAQPPATSPRSESDPRTEFN